MRLFLCGDVMTGRGIDQVLPHPSDPILYEPYARSAREYVELAERANGPVEAPRDFAYIWGDAIEELERRKPDARIVNLETAVTTSADAWPLKGIHYRMHPANVACLAAARIDCCVLANNHVLDWGRAGLAQTLAVLHGAGLRTAGAGLDEEEAAAPAVMPSAGGRVLLFAAALASSGVGRDWAAHAHRAGVHWLPDLSARTLASMARAIGAVRRPGDVIVVSLHWGENWGYEVSPDERRFARGLVEAGADVIHGHSSHHAKGIEWHRGRPILYGCGDFVNDYEGISGNEEFRPELRLMYFLDVAPVTGAVRLEVVAMRARLLRLERADAESRAWVDAMLRRECDRLASPSGTARPPVAIL